MSKGRIVLIVVIMLLVFVSLAWWSGRSHEGDRMKPGDFKEKDHPGTKSLDKAASAVGRLTGMGTEDFDLSRLDHQGGGAFECDGASCESNFSGSATIRISKARDEGELQNLFLERRAGSVSVELQSEDVKNVDPELIEENPMKLAILDSQAILTLRCIQSSCTVRFHPSENRRR